LASARALTFSEGKRLANRSPTAAAAPRSRQSGLWGKARKELQAVTQCTADSCGGGYVPRAVSHRAVQPKPYPSITLFPSTRKALVGKQTDATVRCKIRGRVAWRGTHRRAQDRRLAKRWGTTPSCDVRCSARATSRAPSEHTNVRFREGAAGGSVASHPRHR